MPSTVVLAVGTRKGLFLLKSGKERSTWELAGPFLNGHEINHAIIDPRTRTLFATANNPWFGNAVASSPDLGATWREGLHAPRFPEEAGRSVERLWRL
ncbi:MAG TPA: hypothetical protein VNN21_10750, partial [Dehalococcoidia bacterium]|nr:hypothetical protein [Dehalococcoidia bacterium]